MGLICYRTVFAASNKVKDNNIGFSVSAKIPKNQLHKENTFFDLKMDQGQSESLQTTIYNITNQDIKVKTAIHTAYTNSNGTIEYVTPGRSYDKSLTYRMSDITKIQGSDTVTVPANGSKVVTAKVVVPNKRVNGVILGGWYFKRIDKKVTGKVKESVNVTNQYSYVIGLKYSLGEIPTPTLKLQKVEPGLINYHRGIFPYIRNISSVIVPNLTMQTEIINKNTGKTIQRLKKNNVQFAPNSVFKYPILTGKKKLQAGNYKMHMILKNEKHRWVFNKNFKISIEEAQKYNREDVSSRGLSMWALIGVGFLIAIVLIGLLVGLVYWTRSIKRKR